MHTNPPTDETILTRSQSRFVVRLTAMIAGGMFIDGFILGIIGVLMPSITADLNLDATWQGLIGASPLFGIFIGGPLGGFLADKIGRRPMFTIDLMAFLIGSLAQYFVTDAPQLFVVRFLMGVAIGADYAIGWPMLVEFVPARIRGRLLALQEIGWFAGYTGAYALAWVLTVSTRLDWHVMLTLSVVPTLIVLLMRLGTPESPRWLMSVGRTAEAMTIATEYMPREEIADLRLASSTRSLSFRHLFRAPHAKATFFISLYWLCNVTPFFAIGAFAPIVLSQLGLGDGMMGGLALNGLAMLGVLFCTAFIDNWGRRALCVVPSFICVAALALLAVPGQTTALVMIGVLTFSFFNAMAATLTVVYPGELFPTDIRGAGVGFATAVSRIGAAMGTFLLPISMERLGLPATMLVATGLCALGAVVAWACAPETNGLLLSKASNEA